MFSAGFARADSPLPNGMYWVAIVLDGKIITMHGVRTILTGGKMQITRCTDRGCDAIFSKLKNAKK